MNTSSINKFYFKQVSDVKYCEQALEKVDYAANYIDHIMKYLNIQDWAIGGSTALAMHGIFLKRPLGDIDIIIPQGALLVPIVSLIIHSPLIEYIEESKTFYYGVDHIKFKTVSGQIIDIVESGFPVIDTHEVELYKGNTIKVVTPYQIMKIKRKYGRSKDLEDLAIIEEFFK